MRLPAAELGRQFERLSQVVDAQGDPQGALQRIVDLAQHTVAGCDWAAVTRAGSRARTLAATDDVARAVDDVQIAAGDGPCLTAARDAIVIHVPDLAAETRWPAFCEQALRTTPVRSVLTFQIDRAEPRVALNLFAGRPHAFDEEDLAVAALFATHARVAVLHLTARTKSANLEVALTTSRLIGEAVGVLMALHRLTSDEAFELLRSASQNLNRKLRDVAEEVTTTGALPVPDRHRQG